MNIKQKVEKCLENVRPALEMHNGNVELVGVDEKKGVVSVKFQGACTGCPMSQITLKMGIEAEIISQVPEVNQVVAVGAQTQKACCGGINEHEETCCTDENNEDILFAQLMGED